MPRALICSAVDVEPELGHTLLWRKGMERQMARRLDEAKSLAASTRPDIVIIDRDFSGADQLIASLRQDAATRTLSVVILARGDFEPADVDLLEAGANAILRLPPGSDWDERLMRLIEVPARKDTRFSVFFKVETSGDGDMAPIMATALNLSISGMLIEATHPMTVGDQLHLQFRLPELDELVKAEGRVVRQAGARRFGVEFMNLTPQGLDGIRRFVSASGGGVSAGW